MSDDTKKPNNVVSITGKTIESHQDSELNIPHSSDGVWYTDQDVVSFLKVLGYIQYQSNNLEAKIILDPTHIAVELNCDGNREAVIDDNGMAWGMTEDKLINVTMFATISEISDDEIDIIPEPFTVDEIHELLAKLRQPTT